MRMKLVGMTAIREGTSKKDEAYCFQTLHLEGKRMDVEGTAVANVRVDYTTMNNLPSFELGSLYDVDLSDRGYLRNIELLENATQKRRQLPGS